jgi:hypothetical protein
MRGREDEFTLDRNGFQIVRRSQAEQTSMLRGLDYNRTTDMDTMKKAVGPLVGRFLETRLNAQTVIPFSFMVCISNRLHSTTG